MTKKYWTNTYDFPIVVLIVILDYYYSSDNECWLAIQQSLVYA